MKLFEKLATYYYEYILCHKIKNSVKYYYDRLGFNNYKYVYISICPI